MFAILAIKPRKVEKRDLEGKITKPSVPPWETFWVQLNNEGMVCKEKANEMYKTSEYSPRETSLF